LRQCVQRLIRAIATTAFLIGALFVNFGRGYAADFFQPSEIFEKAIRNRSTHAYIIFATIINERTGETRSECIAASLLRGAIHKEYDLKYDAPSIEKAIEIALANQTREFHFSKQAATDNIPLSLPENTIDNLPLPEREARRHLQLRLKEACVLVRQGKSVFLADMTGQVSVDRTK
jgi:hypothetical protein